MGIAASFAKPVLRVLGLSLACTGALAAELRLELVGPPRIFTTEALLARPDVRELEILSDVVQGQLTRYHAVPLANLLEGVLPGDAVQAVAANGAVAELSAAPLLAATDAGARAWVAIEEPHEPWPMRADNQSGGGPFALVWTRPEAGGIGPEQWPEQLVALRRLPPVIERFPALLPDPALPATHDIRRGMDHFVRYCMACHTLDGQGDAQLGPDLNRPLSPVEYLPADLLRAYIRNPQSLRRWPQARMPAFGDAVLPDDALDDILAYLRHMAVRKEGPAPEAPVTP